MRALVRQRSFALLWLGGLISLTGDWVLYAALPFYVYQQTGSTFATALMVAAELLPNLLLGSVAGVFVDRWDRRRVMLVTSLLEGGVVLLLLRVGSAETVWLVYVVGATNAALGTFFGPAESALLPRLVADQQLVPANALNALNNNLARVLGLPLGGLLLGSVGLWGVVLFDSATFLLAAALSVLLGPPNVAANAAIQALLQRHVPDAYLGRVYGALGTSISLLSLVSVLGLAGALGEVVGLWPMLNVAAGLNIAAGVLALTVLPRAERRTATGAPEDGVA